MNKQELIDFEEEICELFNQGLIKAPVHLDNGNEEELIKIFKNIRKQDWVLCTWRSHYKCLLKGVPKNILKKDILNRKSIGLCYKEYRVLSSAIVGGNLGWAVGLGLSIKLQNKDEKVYVFVGEMSSEIGLFFESWKYCTNFNLPVIFIIEDNNQSVCTNTREVWGTNKLYFENIKLDNIVWFKYKSKYPHAGGGKRINF